MTIVSQNGFGARIKNVQRKHVRMAQGYDAKVGRDGLIVFRPKRRKAGLPLRWVVVALAGAIVFKGLIIANLGAAAYADRIEALRAGSVVEKFGAAVMQPDPVSLYISAKFAPIFN
ncbi:hypothetical protein [Roseovarius carneus]|uniref:hypothetical protein n=1 Tax=Roseovarius carneus TaxID=2853164 RepID=UPI001CCC4A8A|nr:hypothetical protein [Roseovarius carneus]